MLMFLILLHTNNNNNGDSFLVLLQQTLAIKNIYYYYYYYKSIIIIYYYLLLIMPIQKNNSCRMGGPKKGQWVAILLIRRASTAGVVCNVYVRIRSYHLLQTLGNLFLSSSSSSPGSKEKNTNLLD